MEKDRKGKTIIIAITKLVNNDFVLLKLFIFTINPFLILFYYVYKDMSLHLFSYFYFYYIILGFNKVY